MGVVGVWASALVEEAHQEVSSDRARNRIPFHCAHVSELIKWQMSVCPGENPVRVRPIAYTPEPGFSGPSLKGQSDSPETP
jgi:hypothetical protein